MKLDMIRRAHWAAQVTASQRPFYSAPLLSRSGRGVSLDGGLVNSFAVANSNPNGLPHFSPLLAHAWPGGSRPTTTGGAGRHDRKKTQLSHLFRFFSLPFPQRNIIHHLLTNRCDIVIYHETTSLRETLVS